MSSAPPPPSNENTPLTGNVSVDSVLIGIMRAETVEQISQNWRSILTIGIINVIAGFFCLLFPFFATAVMEMALTWAVLLTGIFSILAGCHYQSPDNQDVPHPDFFLMGGVQILLALLMFMHPLFTLTILTILIALLFMMLGISRLALAKRNPDMPHRFFVQLSGVLAIIMSVFICFTMPLARWYTIGVLLGVNLVNIGFARIGLAYHGRSLAASESSYSLLPS